MKSEVEKQTTLEDIESFLTDYGLMLFAGFSRGRYWVELRPREVVETPREAERAYAETLTEAIADAHRARLAAWAGDPPACTCPAIVRNHDEGRWHITGCAAGEAAPVSTR